MIGPGFDADKHEDGRSPSVNLGVSTDFAGASRSYYPMPPAPMPSVTVGVTAERRLKLADTVSDVLESGVITHTTALRLYGKARFVVCPIFGRIGLGLLHRLPSVERTEAIPPWSPLYGDLRTLHEILPRLRAVEYPLFPRRAPPVIVLTDAMEDAGTCPWGQVGVVVWSPAHGRLYYSGGVLPERFRTWLQGLRSKQTYITQYELFAALIAYLTFPDLLYGQLVHHFVDNQGAMHNLISAYTSKPDSMRIVNMLHVQVLSLACQPWFGFVYSEDNLSDLPSRGDFRLLSRLGAVWRPLVLPQLSYAWTMPLRRRFRPCIAHQNHRHQSTTT
jgi:hypothetical protein|eukprot:3912800-Prymnesium_polylepis.2